MDWSIVGFTQVSLFFFPLPPLFACRIFALQPVEDEADVLRGQLERLPLRRVGEVGEGGSLTSVVE